MQQIKQLARGPSSRKITNLTISRPTKMILSSGVSLYTSQTSGIDAIKVEIAFEAGRLYESKRMVSSACGALLLEGSEKQSSAEISETVDFLGGYISSYANADFLFIKLVSAKKNFLTLLELLKEILEKPRFSKQELDIFISRRKQKMSIDLSKNDVIAYRTLTGSIYGEETSYGYNSSPETLDQLTTDDLLDHYKNYCTSESANIFISGDFDSKHIDCLDQLKLPQAKGYRDHVSYETTLTSPQSFLIAGRETQTSLKIGSKFCLRKDPEYSTLYFLNTLLGGYFGSRLMKKIREDKGYTYNVYSMMDSNKYDSSWIISCDLDHSNVEKALAEIGNEFKKLREHLVSDEEMDMVRNYMMGNFMSTINGPFKAINPNKTSILLGLNDDFYDDLFKNIQNIGAKEIREAANEYLFTNKFWKVIVGKS